MSTVGKLAMVAFTITFLMGAEQASAQVLYTINGRPATQSESRFMLNNRLPFGDYWFNQQTGCWGVVTRYGPSACLGKVYASGGGGGMTTCGVSGCVTTDGAGGAFIGH